MTEGPTMPGSPTTAYHVTETGQKRLELIGRTRSSTTLIGGNDGSGTGFTSGPGPHELLCAALSACTAMTIRLFAERLEWPAERIDVSTTYAPGTDGEPGRFDREIRIDGPLTDMQRERLLRAGETCPVGRTLSEASTLSITYRLALELAQTGQAVS